jgi:hypothetical protein
MIYVIDCDFARAEFTQDGRVNINTDLDVADLTTLLAVASDTRFPIAVYHRGMWSPAVRDAIRRFIESAVYDYYRSSPGVGPYIEAHYGKSDKQIIERLTYTDKIPPDAMCIRWHFE